MMAGEASARTAPSPSPPPASQPDTRASIDGWLPVSLSSSQHPPSYVPRRRASPVVPSPPRHEPKAERERCAAPAHWKVSPPPGMASHRSPGRLAWQASRLQERPGRLLSAWRRQVQQIRRTRCALTKGPVPPARRCFLCKEAYHHRYAVELAHEG